MNVIDCFSKFAWSIPLQKKTKEQVGYALKRLFLNEGAPKIMHMDNGKEFVNEYFEGVCAEYSTCIVKGRPRHPQSQGQIERFNQTICRAIAKTICANNTKRWLDSLDEIIGAYNRTIHRATKFSPILLFKGTTGSPLITEKNDNYAGDFSSELANIREKAAENAKIYRANMVRRASVHRKKKVYLPGQSVLLKRDFDTNQKTKKRKFQSFYQNGIATIEKANTNNSYNIKIEDEEGTKIVIAKSSQLKVLKK
jgi:ribosomal protein L21E